LPPGVEPPVSAADLKFLPICVVLPGRSFPKRFETTQKQPIKPQPYDGAQIAVLPASNRGTAYPTNALYAVRPLSAAPLEQVRELPILAGNAVSNPNPVARAKHP